MLQQQYHENFEVQHINKLPRRAFYIPFQQGNHRIVLKRDIKQQMLLY